MKVSCNHCQKEFEKAPCQVSLSPNHFCSRSCSAKYNNKKFPKRKKINLKTCDTCGKNVGKLTTKRCQDCVFKLSFLKTKKEYEYTNSKNRASKYCRIRQHARLIAKKNGLLNKSCAKCDYSKHVEICHIKSISEFSDDSIIGEINDISNLIQLCPNCHWEHDNNKTIINPSYMPISC